MAKDPITGRFIPTHALSDHPIYNVWLDMRARCFDPKDPRFHCYGTRGITVDPRWRESFASFYADMHDSYRTGLTIERKNNDGPYCKSNCRWATRAEQARNKSNNHRLSFDGKNLLIVEWSQLTGIPDSTIGQRLARGWSVEKTLTTTPRKMGLAYCRKPIARHL